MKLKEKDTIEGIQLDTASKLQGFQTPRFEGHVFFAENRQTQLPRMEKHPLYLHKSTGAAICAILLTKDKVKNVRWCLFLVTADTITQTYGATILQVCTNPERSS